MNQKLTNKQIIIGFAIGAVAIPTALFLDRAGYKGDDEGIKQFENYLKQRQSS